MSTITFVPHAKVSPLSVIVAVIATDGLLLVTPCIKL